MDSGFELRGSEADETKTLLHRATGFSVAIPGHASVSVPNARTFELKLADAKIEVLYRLDSLPGTLEAKPLAASLALAYMTSACQEPGRLGPAPVPKGAHAAASGTYERRGADDRTMEFLTVIVRRGEAAADVLYQVVRFRRGELGPIEWANMRTTLASTQDWTQEPRDPLAVWPTSVFVAPGIVMKLLPPAWKEAEGKAAMLRDVSDDDVSSLTELLVTFGVSNDPPSHPLQRYVLDLGARQVAMRCTSATAEVLLRNFYTIKNTQDLRGWCTQCLWALGHRPSS